MFTNNKIYEFWLKKKNRVPYLVLFLFLLISYGCVNHFNGTRVETYRVIKCYLDDFIPFYPPMIYVYVSWYLHLAIILLVLFFSAHKRAEAYFKILLITASVGMLIAQIIFLICPTYCQRPDLQTLSWRNGVTEFLLNWIYSHDYPTNCFPSSHVLVSAVFGHYFIRYLQVSAKSFWLRSLFLVWTIVIWFSTVLVKQHYCWDVLAGVAIAYILIYFMPKILSKISPDIIQK